MENIYEGCSETEKEEIINELESNFTSVFQQLVDKTEERETEGREQVLLAYDDGKQSKPGENEQEGNREGAKKNQTNSTIVQRNLELHLSSEAQQKIQDILNEVRQLSEKEKLLLYLKLPTKTGDISEESQPIPLSNTRQEQTQAFQWIRSNLVECESTYTLPKHEVYDDYKAYCESLGANRTLSAPDFGKIIKCVFPKVKARRLGTRGNSKYCYSGLRKRVAKEAPSLPSLDGSSENELNNNNHSNNNNNNTMNDCNDLTEDQTLSAACSLVCEWANKLLGRVFTTLLDLARFLVGGSYVSTKSMAAFVVMSATENKVRKMSEKLQFRSSSSASSISPDSKSSAPEGKRSPRKTAASNSSDNLVSKSTKALPNAQTQQKNCFQGNQYQPSSDGPIERPQSLPGLQIVTGNQDTIKPMNHLMSPPQCPPPKTNMKATSLQVASPGFTGSVVQMRGNPAPTNAFLRTSEGAFPILGPQQASPGFTSQSEISSPNQVAKRHSRVQRNNSSLKRSDSCPYPSQSPRASRQAVGSPSMASLSPRTPADMVRNQTWQTTVTSLEHNIISSDNTVHSMRDLNALLQEQKHMSPSLRSTNQHETMTTPNNRQPLLQRCHSVPVPYSSPQGDIYQPLTPQLGAQPRTSQDRSNRSPTYGGHLKDMRAKFLNNEVQSSVRRNLTPSFLSSEGGEMLAVKKSRTISIQSHSRNLESNIPSPQDRKQQLGIIDEASLASVDSLIDSPFSLGIDASGGCDANNSGGSGLSDLDGLDDAVTMDLLRSLNSGNNIWANEWNNPGMQLMGSN